jgi:hypothetical protein
VSGEDVGAHAMHWERVSVPLATLEEVTLYVCFLGVGVFLYTH